MKLILFRLNISKFSNFRFAVIEGVCPYNSLTLPLKEFIVFGGQLLTFVNIIMLLLLSKIVKSVMICARACTKQASIHTDIELEGDPVEITNYNTLSTAAASNQTLSQSNLLNYNEMLMITVIKLLKLYFTPVTKVALNLIHCVYINDALHLFVYGEVKCYTYWQVIIVALLLPSLVLFPLSFEMCIRLLKKQKISSFHFTLALCCPYYAIIMYTWKIVQGKRRAQSLETVDHTSMSSFTRIILKAEEELFVDSKGSVGWQIVQLYRAFAVIALNIFFINPIYRTLVFIPVLTTFLIHDCCRMPYKHHYANILQILSSTCLIIVVVCNAPSAVSYMLPINRLQYIDSVVQMSSIIELVTYGIVPLSLPTWMVWARLKEHYRKQKEQ